MSQSSSKFLATNPCSKQNTNRKIRRDLSYTGLSDTHKRQFMAFLMCNNGVVYKWDLIKTSAKNPLSTNAHSIFKESKGRNGKLIRNKAIIIHKIGSYKKMQRLIRKLKENGIMDDLGIALKYKAKTKKFLETIADTQCLSLNNQGIYYVNRNNQNNTQLRSIRDFTAWRKNTILKIHHFSGHIIKTRGHPQAIKDSQFCFSFKQIKREQRILEVIPTLEEQITMSNEKSETQLSRFKEKEQKEQTKLASLSAIQNTRNYLKEQKNEIHKKRIITSLTEIRKLRAKHKV